MKNSRKVKKHKAAILGAGRLGTTLGYVINKKNSSVLSVSAVATPSGASLDRARYIMGDTAPEVFFTRHNSEAADRADIIFICTPDDLIETVCRNLYRSQQSLKKTVIHFSGSRSLEVLEAASARGDCTASIHPLKSFASIPGAINTIKGTEYGVTYKDREGERITSMIVGLLEGSSIFVRDEAKPVYHAAACIASNYLVTLIDHAVYINQKIGIEPQASTRGLLNLIEGTVDNIKKMGTEKALTGPVARGDVGTIKGHIEMMDRLLEDKDMEIYRTMGKKTADLARSNGWIDSRVHEEFMELFSEVQERKQDG